MRRRIFLQSLSVVFLPFARQPTQLSNPPAYTDSAGRTPAQLAALHDGRRAGVVYQP